MPVPTVHSRTLSKVLEYCKKHVAEAEVAPDANGDADADAAADTSAAGKSLEEWDKVRYKLPIDVPTARPHKRPVAALRQHRRVVCLLLVFAYSSALQSANDVTLTVCAGVRGGGSGSVV